MRRILSSPRGRRRLYWIGSLLVVVGGAVALGVFMPESTPKSESTGNEGPAQLAEPKAHLTPADRRAINATLDRFVPAAVLHKSPETAWALSGPELRGSSTLADWQAGTTPVQYYPVQETSFHDWRVIDVTRNAVILNLLVHPKAGSKLGSYVYSGEVVRRGAGWIVNRWYTIAVMNPVRGKTHEIGPADFSAPQASQVSVGKSTRGFWLIPAIGVLVLAPTVLLGFAAVGVRRERRFRRQLAEAGRREMPPLPRAR